ncbi:MAG: DHH family phosphoesterase [Candidatus Saccharimonadales bacterium]
MKYPEATKLAEIVSSVQRIVIVQADNPDADSLGSSLALEHILGDLGKHVVMYCGVDIPGYLRYLSGWDRVVKELPSQFEASIIVDASTLTLLEKLSISGQLAWLKSKPSIVLDHHAIVENKIDFAHVTLCDDGVSSTGELIYHVASQLGWAINKDAGANIMTAILGDTQGLTNDLAKEGTYTTMAALVALGVDRPKLEELRREYGKMPEEIYRYKAELIARTEIVADGRLALVTVPQHEINTFSPLYNPAPLVQNDMLQISGVRVAIVLKSYDDGKITGAIRANQGSAVAGKLAEKLGGGGHPYAGGFKQTDGRPFSEVKLECIQLATELLDDLR